MHDFAEKSGPKCKSMKNGDPAYSERFRPVIPTEAGHLFRAKAASHSDLKPATFWPGSEWVAGMHRNGESL